MLNVHLFFVKLFGCQIMESDYKLKNKIPIDIQTFSNAICNQQAHPRIYLSFKYMKHSNIVAGASDVCVSIDKENKNTEAAFAICIYCTDNLLVHIIYALPGEEREGLKSAWHPKFGCQRFLFEQASSI
jgi:hypothetical protein